MAALGLAAEELRLVLLTLLARASLLAAATFLDAFLIDYDTSKSITPAERDQSAATGSTGSGLLRGWAVWDAVFFSDIAVRGYVYEQYYAFFPLLPGELVKLLCTGSGACAGDRRLARPKCFYGCGMRDERLGVDSANSVCSPVPRCTTYSPAFGSCSH